MNLPRCFAVLTEAFIHRYKLNQLHTHLTGEFRHFHIGFQSADKLVNICFVLDCNDEVLLKEEDDPVLLPPFSCHTLRHTFTTRLCEAGVNIKVIQSVLGHADISTTMDIYCDVTKDLKQKEFGAFGEYFKENIV